MMVVILIMAIAAAVVIPRLPAPESTRLKTSARNLATGIRFLNDEAIITKGIFRLELDLTENATRVSKYSLSGEELQMDDQVMSQLMNHRLVKDGITIEDVTTPRLGKVSEGQVTIPFGPGGNPDGVIIHLKGGEQHYTIIAYPAGGKVKVLEGYQEGALEEEAS